MTNPGHVDPGYEGKLHLTVINMSRSPIPLRISDAILTVIFYKLSADCKAGYAERHEKKTPTDVTANLLSPDFLDVTKRATDITNAAVTKSALYAGVIALTITIVSSLLPYYFDTKREIAVMQESNKYTQEKITELQSKIDALEKNVTRNPENLSRQK